VIFHNLAGYDAHLFIKSLGFSEGKIDCIPNNEEKYISFKKDIVVGSWIKVQVEFKFLIYNIFEIMVAFEPYTTMCCYHHKSVSKNA